MARQKGKIFRVEPFLSYECGQKCLTESYTAANGSLIMLTTRNGPPKVNPLCASLSLPLSLSLSFARSCHLPLSFAYKFSLLATLRRAHLLDYINLGQVGALCVSATPCYLPIPLLPPSPCRRAGRQGADNMRVAFLSRQNDTTHKTLFVCLSA